MNRTEAIKVYKLSASMVTAIEGMSYSEHEAKREDHTGYRTHADIHPRTRKALHERGIMHGHYYLTREGVNILAALAGNVVDAAMMSAPGVEIQGEEPCNWEPEFNAPGAAECYFGCGRDVVAVFVDYVGRTEGLCATHRDRVDGQTYDVPATPQTDAESLSVDDLTPNGRVTYAYYANNGMDDATALRKAADMCGTVEKETQEETEEMTSIPTVNVVQAHMGMNGMNHYHAPGCRDIEREAKRHNARKDMGVYEFPFSSVAAIIEHEYSDCNNGDAYDMIAHANDDFDGLKIMSCLRDSLPLGDIQGMPVEFTGGRWTLETAPLDSERCTVCETFGNVAENSTDVDGKHVCGYCVDSHRTLANLSSHSLMFYVETESGGVKHSCGDCGSIATRGEFAQFKCDHETDAGFVETEGPWIDPECGCERFANPSEVPCPDHAELVPTVSTGTTHHSVDSQGGEWVRFDHVLTVGDVVKITGSQGVYEVHALIPGLPVVYVLGTTGEPFPVGATTLYAL